LNIAPASTDLIQEFDTLRYDPLAGIETGDNQDAIAVQGFYPHLARYEPLGVGVLINYVLSVSSSHDRRPWHGDPGFALLRFRKDRQKLSHPQAAGAFSQRELDRDGLVAVSEASALVV
jgi:hypothetical protein